MRHIAYLGFQQRGSGTDVAQESYGLSLAAILCTRLPTWLWPGVDEGTCQGVGAELANELRARGMRELAMACMNLGADHDPFSWYVYVP